MSKEGTGEVTGLLRVAGEDANMADRLWELVYPELRRRAANLVRNERSDHTLSATAVVNEAFVRLSTRMAHEWEDRSHFYNTASGIMRHVLIDHARSHRADKRGGGAAKQELDESVFPSVQADDEGFQIAERALERLAGLAGVPGLDHPASATDARGELSREYLTGRPLHEAEQLPRDFFERLEELVRAVHARGVCHNDLHKEQNVLVGEDGRPALIDFQLASVHARRGRAFHVRTREDLRHVEKHRRRYLRAGRPKTDADRAGRPRRSLLAWAWRRGGKPVYHLVAGLAGTRDGEPRRPSSGPWPVWTEPVGPRSQKGA